MRRAVIVVAVALGMLAPAVPVSAGEGLRDYLEGSSAADFEGRGIVYCTWAGDQAAVTYEVTRHDGMSMAHGPDGDLMISSSLVAMRSGTSWYAVEAPDRTQWTLSDRYRLGSPASTTRLGRDALEYTVWEGDLERVRLIVDQVTSIPLLTEIFDDDGDVYRLAALIDFDETPEAMPPMPATGSAHRMEHTDPSQTLPASTAGYERLDTYTVPGGGTQSYYGDGLFAFSVFETKRGSTPAAFADASKWTYEGARYLFLVTPSQVWLQWHAPDRSYVLVGDLPPDHLAEVLRDLPRPGNRGFFTRLWRRIFG